MSVEQTREQEAKKRKIIVVIGVVLLFIVVVSVPLSRPKRSVAAFCSTYRNEDGRLKSSKGDTYSLKPFSHSSSNPKDFVIALGKLDKVAPADIQPDVRTLKQIFEKIDNDPSQALSASLSGLSPESNLSDWVNSHCR